MIADAVFRTIGREYYGVAGTLAFRGGCHSCFILKQKRALI